MLPSFISPGTAVLESDTGGSVLYAFIPLKLVVLGIRQRSNGGG